MQELFFVAARWSLVVALGSLLVLQSCEQVPPPDERVVKLILVADSKAVAEACRDSGIIEDLGCARGSAQTKGGQGRKDCTIVAIKPRNYEDARRLQTLGHELWHCFQGPEHP